MHQSVATPTPRPGHSRGLTPPKPGFRDGPLDKWWWFFFGVKSPAGIFLFCGGRRGEGRLFYCHNLNLDSRHCLIAWNRLFRLSNGRFASLSKRFSGCSITNYQTPAYCRAIKIIKRLHLNGQYIPLGSVEFYYTAKRAAQPKQYPHGFCIFEVWETRYIKQRGN